MLKELPVIAHAPSLEISQDPIIGIDLGTTNSLAAIVEKGVPRILRSRENQNLVPSVVHFRKDADPEIGFTARKQRVLDPEHTIYSVKRLLGRGADDLKEILNQLPFHLEGSDPSNVKISIEGRAYTPIEISALILKELKASAEVALDRSVEDAVITVPAYFNDSQRQATRAAGRLAGFNVLRILNEPTAAALAYGLEKKKNGLIAVFDLGGGTFDISILKLHNGIFEVLSTNGDTRLGGDDMDQSIAQWVRSKVEPLYPHIDFLKRENIALLLELAENLKIQLSQKDKAEGVLSLKDQKPFSVNLSQKELEAMLMPLLERTRNPVKQALLDADLSLKDITEVALVGGPTRLGFIRKFVSNLFEREPNCSLHPEEVVALGAAIQADILAGNNKEFLLLDIVPLSLGIETFGGAMSKLIERNTRIPTLAKEQFTTFVNGQTKIAIHVFQGERELVKDNRKLAEFVLHGVPAQPAGKARIEVTFLVDADGILNVSAKDLTSGAFQSIEVKPSYGLTDADVERMLAQGLAEAQTKVKT